MKAKLIIIATAAVILSACDQQADKKTLGNTKDTNSVNSLSPADTANTNQPRDTANNKAKGTNTSNGNADPSGRVPPQSKK